MYVSLVNEELAQQKVLLHLHLNLFLFTGRPITLTVLYIYYINCFITTIIHVTTG